MDFSNIDIVVFVGYCLLIIGVGLWMSREKEGHEKNAEDYFLASKSLPWWAIGASLIASNISAEQFIGMSGSGYAVGLGIAAYEWMGAITLILVAKYFMPIFIKEKIFTMPQFLEHRYNKTVKTTMAVFWLLVYVFVNLTSVMYLGALALEGIGDVPLLYGIIGLALFSAAYAIYGGLKAVVWTDVLQVVFLVAGGLITTYLALNQVSEGKGVLAGLGELYNQVPAKFDLILDKSSEYYKDLPGISVLVGGLWIANLSYWGCNQYIIQRALAAKTIGEAQNGVLFAGFLKLIIPLIVVIPGIAAFVITEGTLGKPDEAYPWLLGIVPTGIKGLAFAALIAAVVSSLSSMINSISTIFTMDIYKEYFDKEASQTKMVFIGRLVSGIALVIAITVAPQLATLDQAFQFIQEFTGFVSPGVTVIFLFGFFWKKTTSNGALAAAILSIPMSYLFMYFLPEVPFMDRMGYTFLILSAITVLISLIEGSKGLESKGIHFTGDMFKTSAKFNIGALFLTGIISAIYALLW
ncbi:transporter (plasmid) [Fulvitalea axinellae]|uniref:Transporter n=1 Tax=Fulvitalea axinellae TaxID=1182444 RepID=A0AAU9D403_9BACT|nr:transporter [Fulvitalea axinellae]